VSDEGETKQEMFDRVLHNASPVPEQLHELLLANLTTSPHSHSEQLGLVWMQCQPGQWDGHHPGSCLDVAEMIIERQGP
jgi:hypothetical protein